MRELPQHPIVQLSYKSGILINQSISSALRIAHHDGVTDRLRGRNPASGSRKTKAVAAKAEFGDMAPAIREQFADPDGTGDDRVPAIGNVTLGVDRLVASKAAARADLLQRYEGIQPSGMADGWACRMAGFGRVAEVLGVKLLVHAPSLPLASSGDGSARESLPESGLLHRESYLGETTI